MVSAPLATAYLPGTWITFALAVSAVAATLAGLLFVAVSLNLKRILEYPNLPARAAQTLILFATPLITGLFLVVPGQSRAVVACELLITGLAIGTGQLVINARSPHSDHETRLTWLVGRVFPAVASSGFLVISGAALLARAAGGLYWIVPSVLVAIVFGLVNAWVLLVEIQR